MQGVSRNFCRSHAIQEQRLYEIAKLKQQFRDLLLASELVDRRTLEDRRIQKGLAEADERARWCSHSHRGEVASSSSTHGRHPPRYFEAPSSPSDPPPLPPPPPTPPGRSDGLPESFTSSAVVRSSHSSTSRKKRSSQHGSRAVHNQVFLCGVCHQ